MPRKAMDSKFMEEKEAGFVIHDGSGQLAQSAEGCAKQNV